MHIVPGGICFPSRYQSHRLYKGQCLFVFYRTSTKLSDDKLFTACGTVTTVPCSAGNGPAAVDLKCHFQQVYVGPMEFMRSSVQNKKVKERK